MNATIDTDPASVEARIAELHALVQKSGWQWRVDEDTEWYLDAMSAALLLLLDQRVEYVTGKMDEQETAGVLLIFGERVIVKVEINPPAGADPGQPHVIAKREAVVSSVPRTQVVSARASAPLNHSTSRWKQDTSARYQGWPGAVQVTVDYGDGNAWTLPLEGPPRTEESRAALLNSLPSLLSAGDLAPGSDSDAI